MLTPNICISRVDRKQSVTSAAGDSFRDKVKWRWFQGGPVTQQSGDSGSRMRKATLPQSGSPFYYLYNLRPSCLTLWHPPLPDLHVYHLALDLLLCPLGYSHITPQQLAISGNPEQVQNQCEFISMWVCVCVFRGVSLTVSTYVGLSLSMSVCIRICEHTCSLCVCVFEDKWPVFVD